MSQRAGRDILVEVLRTEGVTHVFGNPGTTELPFVDALAEQSDIRYVLALQEASAVAMADGYAQATGRPAFVNLHTDCGLGNAIGNLTSAVANQAPLVVTAGQQDERHLAADPLLAGDLVGLAAPVSKWAHEVRNVDELGTYARRAFHDAQAPRRGPVFLGLRMSTLEDTTELEVPPPSRIEYRTVGSAVDELASQLCKTTVGKLAIVIGDEVTASGATAAVGELAEALGAPVFTTALHGTALFPPTHPMWAGMLPYSAASIREVLKPYETLFLIGSRVLAVALFTEGAPIGAGTRLLQLAPDPTMIGRTYPVDLGVTGDPRATIEALLPLVREAADTAAAHAACEARAAARSQSITAREEAALDAYPTDPMRPIAAAHALVRALPKDSIVVDEGITTGVYVREFHHWTAPGRYYFCKGGGLGWGMPAAVGVSLATGGDVPVLSVVGDGSAMYSPQAMWTAAHEGLPVLFAVTNNQQYLLLKKNLAHMKHLAPTTERFLGMDLDHPAIDFVALGQAMGLPSLRVERAADVAAAVRDAVDRGGPALLELPIAAEA